MDRVLALQAGSRGFDSHRGHMSERFFRSNRPGYPHPVSSELENSGIRVAVGDCSVTERRRWRPPYQTGKTVHVHAKHYKHKEDGRTAPGVCGNGSVPLSHSGNVVTRIGIHTLSVILSLELIVSAPPVNQQNYHIWLFSFTDRLDQFSHLHLYRYHILCAGRQTPGRKVLSLRIEIDSFLLYNTLKASRLCKVYCHILSIVLHGLYF